MIYRSTTQINSTILIDTIPRAMSNEDCGSDCWFLKDDLALDELRINDSDVAAISLQSQSLPEPIEIAQKLYNSLYPWQTRLVRLEPGAFQEALKCTLLTAEIVSFEGIVNMKLFHIAGAANL
jgi:hypothetical protein